MKSYIFSLVFLFLISPLNAVKYIPGKHALTFQVDHRSQQCFFTVLRRGQKFGMNFEVIRGGLLDITCKIKDPKGNSRFDSVVRFNDKDDKINEENGRIEFDVNEPGIHEICFDNYIAKWTPKVVSFSTDMDLLNEDPQAVVKGTDLDPMIETATQVAHELDSLIGLQHRMRVREYYHRDLQEDTNMMVQWLSILESVLLIGASLFQLFYIRSLFSDTKRSRV